MPMPAVTANMPIQSRRPVAFGAMKSARQKSGRSTGLSTCWRRKGTMRVSPGATSSSTSSPTPAAGKSPNTAFATSHFSRMIVSSIARASRYS